MSLGRGARLFRQRWNLFRHMARAKKQGLVRPVVTNLFITTRCNGGCRYCYIDDTLANREMTTAQWKQVIDQLYDMGCRMFNLMGGEPLLRHDFEELLEHILAKDVVCDVNTNCFLVPKHLPALKRATQIFTSLDGDEEAHDRSRGKGTFRKTMDGILAARAEGIPVRVNCTVTRFNVDKIDFLVRLCEEQNMFLTFTPLIRSRPALRDELSQLWLEDQPAKEAFARIKAAKRDTFRIMNSDASLDFFINYPVPLGTIVRRDETGPHAGYYDLPCPYGRMQTFVVSNGDVFPCHNMWNEPSFHPKNVLNDGVEEAVNNASRLWCKYCWLANLAEWNEFTSLPWLVKGVGMTIKQALAGGTDKHA